MPVSSSTRTQVPSVASPAPAQAEPCMRWTYCVNCSSSNCFLLLFCILTVNVLPGPDWPWRCYLFNRPRHFLSHVRLFLQVQVISRVLCTKLGKVKSDPVLIFAQKLDLSLRNLRKKN